jgi:hypothetical protein
MQGMESVKVKCFESFLVQHHWASKEKKCLYFENGYKLIKVLIKINSSLKFDLEC